LKDDVKPLESAVAGGQAAAQPLLEVRGLQKRFGAVQALSDVNLVAPAGQVTALVGDNGAGKSVLIKCIAGIHEPDAGEILWEGRSVHIHTPRDSAALGIEVVYQDLALCDNLDVVQNMFLGRERLQGALLNEDDMERTAAETLGSLRVATLRSIRQPVASLSGGQRQSIAVAKAVMWNSKLVILDEPTAALGVAQTRQVLQLVRRLADRGLAVIIRRLRARPVVEGPRRGERSAASRARRGADRHHLPGSELRLSLARQSGEPARAGLGVHADRHG
jgi:D-xylose transport system permease protein